MSLLTLTQGALYTQIDTYVAININSRCSLSTQLNTYVAININSRCSLYSNMLKKNLIHSSRQSHNNTSVCNSPQLFWMKNKTNTGNKHSTDNERNITNNIVNINWYTYWFYVNISILIYSKFYVLVYLSNKYSNMSIHSKNIDSRYTSRSHNSFHLNASSY